MKLRKDIPLFADQVAEVTARDAYWKWRFDVARNVAHSGEVGGYDMLHRIQGQRLRRQVAALVPPEIFDVMDRLRSSLPANGEYGLDLWGNALAHLTGRGGLRACPRPIMRFLEDQVMHGNHPNL